MSNEFILKKNIFGGFDRRQVIDYLAHLQAKCAESGNKSEIEKARLRIQAYLEKIEEKNNKIEELKKELKDLNDLSTSPVCNIFKSFEEADKIVSSAKKEAEQHIRSASDNVSDNNEKFTLLISRVDSLKAELAQIGSKADNISSKLNKIENVEVEEINEYAVEETIEQAENPIIEEIVAKTPDDYLETVEETEDSPLLTIDEIIEGTQGFSNSIDNFFAELEKLTGSADYYDNGPDINNTFDKSKRILPDDDNSEKDEAFDDMLKNIFHESPDK